MLCTVWHEMLFPNLPMLLVDHVSASNIGFVLACMWELCPPPAGVRTDIEEECGRVQKGYMLNDRVLRAAEVGIVPPGQETPPS